MDVAFLHGLASERVETLRKSLEQDVLTGIEFSGIVQSDGAMFGKGDEVFVYVNIRTGRRAHAEFTVVPEQWLTRKPEGLSHADVAALPGGCLTAYEALTQIAKVGAESRVLIVGAAGSVGSYSVQLAHHLGCHVWAVANLAHSARLKELGADELVDPDKGISDLSGGFDLVFDTPSRYTFKQCEALLKDGGTYIITLPSKDAEGYDYAKNTAKNAGYLMVLEVKRDALVQVCKLVEDGAIKAVVDRTFDFADIAAAHERFEVKGKLGKVVVQIGQI